MRFKKRDTFADLPDDWKTETDQSSIEDINAKIVDLTLNEAANLQAKSEDQDLKEKKEAVKFASEGYRESTKCYRLRIKYIRQVLEGRGKV